MKTKNLFAIVAASALCGLTTQAVRAQDIDSFGPVVVKTVPEAGTKDVPPGEMEIKITFSKKMTDQSWSWSTAWENSDAPALGKPHYEADHKTCVMKVKLEPGKTYGWWLNSQKFHNFKDTQGKAAVPYLLVFQSGQNSRSASGPSVSPGVHIDPASGLPASTVGGLPPGADAAMIAASTDNEVRELIAKGEYDDALQRCLSFHNQFKANISLITLLANWVELGRRFPKAREALIEIRDNDVREFSEGRGYSDLFSEIKNINSYLHQDDTTYELFKSIREKDPELAQQCYFYVESQLVAKGEHQWCYDHMGDPQGRFDLIRQNFNMLRENQKRTAAFQQKSTQQIEALNRQHGLTNAWKPLDTSAMAEKAYEDRFVGDIRQLIEILAATGHQTDAEKIRDQALVALDDPRLQSAVSDAEKKLHGKQAQNDGEPKPATMTAVQDWLALMDSGAYPQSWETAADSFHKAISKDDWIAKLENLRTPLGKLVSRKEIFTQSSQAVLGMPRGFYFTAQFETSFTGLTNAVETVEFMQEKGGQWRAIYYLIRPRTGEQTAAVTAAQKWLAGIDAGNYAASWNDASDYFQGATTQDKWVQALESVRKPLGKLEIRAVNTTVTETQMPGAPDGRYVVMQFAAAFAQKNSATETVTFVLEKDGQWKADGYYIK